MQHVEADAWVAAVQAAMAAGHDRLVTLMGIDDGGLQVWLRLRGADGDDVVLTVDASAGVPTLTALLPTVAWDEREAAELYGIRFHGHATTPLLLAPDVPAPMTADVWLEARQVPWPGADEPGGERARRRQLPPGVRP